MERMTMTDISKGDVPDSPPMRNCQTSLDLLERMPGQTLAIVRGDCVVAVGKFSPWGMEEMLKPGDDIVFEDGRRLEYVGLAPP